MSGSYYVRTKRGDVHIKDDINIENVFLRIPGVVSVNHSDTLEDVLDRYSDVSGLDKEDLSYKMTPKDHIALAEIILEFCGETEGVYTMEGAAIIKDNKCVILQGDSLAGKSRTAYELKKSYSIGGDDSVLLRIFGQKLEFVGGNRHSAPKFWHDNKEYTDFGENAVADLEVVAVIKLKTVYTPNSDKYILQKLSPDNLQFLLWSWVSSKSRSVGSYLKDMEYPLPSLDTNELSKKRLNFCKEASYVPFYFYEGGVENLSSIISMLIKDADHIKEAAYAINYKDSRLK